MTNVAEVRAAMVEVAGREKLFELDYAEVVDPVVAGGAPCHVRTRSVCWLPAASVRCA